MIRSSVCTGERVAGFRDAATGKFLDVMLIRGDKDMRRFLREFGLDEGDVAREW